MGTDIQASIEIATATDGRRWTSTFAAVNLPRDYSLFSLLAGVRSQESGVDALVPPRGLPTDVSSGTMARLEVRVDDEQSAVECEGACTRAEADGWVASGASRYLDAERSRVFDPDAFAVSWLNTAEVARVVEVYRERWGASPTELMAALAAMRACDADGRQARLVMWFRA